MNAIRVQRKRVKGWKMPENTVSVCRPTFFGNPFKVGSEASNEYAVEMYRAWLDETVEGNFTKAKAKRELRGKNLACFCSLDKPCHADVLLTVANGNP